VLKISLHSILLRQSGPRNNSDNKYPYFAHNNYLSANTDRYMNIVKHIYLNTEMVDEVIRICAVQGLNEEKYEKIDEIRVEILQTLSNSLEHTYDDRFMTK
jgi:hypothetical protein